MAGFARSEHATMCANGDCKQDEARLGSERITMQNTPPDWQPPGSGPSHPTAPPPPVPSKRSKRLGIGLGIAAAAVLVVGGGVTAVGFVAYEHQAQVAAEKHRSEVKQKKAKQQEAERKRAEQQEADQAEAQSAYDGVAAETEPLMSALTEVDARLNVGLNYADYAAMIGDVAVAYAGMDIDVLVEFGGLEVGAKLEDAYNKYNRAAQLWNDNLLDYDSIESRMQDKWIAARSDLEEAKNLLDELEPAN